MMMQMQAGKYAQPRNQQTRNKGTGFGDSLLLDPSLLGDEPDVDGFAEESADGGFGSSLMDADVGYGPDGQEAEAFPPEGDELNPNMMRPGTGPSGVRSRLGVTGRDARGTYQSGAGQLGASLNRRQGFGQGAMHV